jgi:hypothetical protein
MTLCVYQVIYDFHYIWKVISNPLSLFLPACRQAGSGDERGVCQTQEKSDAETSSA